MKYTVRIPPEIALRISRFHPVIKAKIRAALDAIREDPHLGKPLKNELSGLHSFRVSQYRIVYRIRHEFILIEVVDIDKRNVVYRKVQSRHG